MAERSVFWRQGKLEPLLFIPRGKQQLAKTEFLSSLILSYFLITRQVFKTSPSTLKVKIIRWEVFSVLPQMQVVGDRMAGIRSCTLQSCHIWGRTSLSSAGFAAGMWLWSLSESTGLLSFTARVMGSIPLSTQNRKMECSAVLVLVLPCYNSSK